MHWILFFVRTPMRFAALGVATLALISVVWPGVVAHVVWVAGCAIFVGLWWLLLELKWLLLAAGLCIAAYAAFRHM